MVFGLIGKPIPCFQVPWFHGLFFQLKPNTLATHHHFPIFNIFPIFVGPLWCPNPHPLPFKWSCQVSSRWKLQACCRRGCWHGADGIMAYDLGPGGRAMAMGQPFCGKWTDLLFMPHCNQTSTALWLKRKPFISWSIFASILPLFWKVFLLIRRLHVGSLIYKRIFQLEEFRSHDAAVIQVCCTSMCVLALKQQGLWNWEYCCPKPDK